MATIEVKITPLVVPDHVEVMVGETSVSVPVAELDENIIMSLIEDFSNTLMEKLTK